MNYALFSGVICTVPKITLLPGTKKVAVCKFVLGTVDGVDKTGKRKWNYFECIAFNETAEMICRSFDKRNHVSCFGKLQNFNFDDENHTKHFTQILMVEGVEFGDVIKYTRAKVGAHDRDPIFAEIKEMDEIFEKFVSDGFLCVDEKDYYKLALNALDLAG